LKTSPRKPSRAWKDKEHHESFGEALDSNTSRPKRCRHIARLESHSKDNPTAHTLRGLARALGVSADYLIGLYTEEDTTTAG
jgi:transcriptional regulator with XRE-family HTH domain